MPPRKLHDPWFHRAKADGYAARSAYKLLQIQDAKNLIRPGDRVLDCGCAPGSWLQVAADLVGPAGAVVGVDLLPVKVPLPDHVAHIRGDLRELSPNDLAALAGGPFDVVLSDMAPNTSGHGDSERSVELCRTVLQVALDTLKPTGALAMKVLEGALYPDLLAETAELFAESRGYKPKASRDVSREMYVIAKGFTPPSTARRHADLAPRGGPPKGWGR